MKKSEIPQDQSALADVSREICYAQNDQGEYETALSTGWEIKTDALNLAWEDVNNRIEAARKEVLLGNKSPIYYFIELRLMNLQILSGYTGFFQWVIKRHFKVEVFKNLSPKKLNIYAKAFDVSLDELKNIK